MDKRETRTPVTVIGLGAMGRAFAEAYLAEGHPTTVWNRTPRRADELVARGAVRAASVAEAVEASPLLIVCVLDYPAVHEVLDPVADALAGRVLVNLTNGTPAQARETADWARERGVDYVDGGIMAVPPMIGQPEALILYSGSSDAYRRHESTLGVLATGSFLGADAGLASLHDLAMLSGMYGMFAGFYHAAALVGSAGVKAAEFTGSLLVPWLTAMLGQLPAMAAEIDTATPAFDDSNPEMQVVAIDNIMETSRAQGVDPELLGHLHSSRHSLEASS